jgi:hypothetical protein
MVYAALTRNDLDAILAEILKVHINKMYEVCKAANVVSILT